MIEMIGGCGIEIHQCSWPHGESGEGDTKTQR